MKTLFISCPKDKLYKVLKLHSISINQDTTVDGNDKLTVRIMKK